MANSTQPSKSDRSYHKLQEQDGENVRDFEGMRAVHGRFIAPEGPRNMVVFVVTVVSSAECMCGMAVCSKCALACTECSVWGNVCQMLVVTKWECSV